MKRPLSFFTNPENDRLTLPPLTKEKKASCAESFTWNVNPLVESVVLSSENSNSSPRSLSLASIENTQAATSNVSEQQHVVSYAVYRPPSSSRNYDVGEAESSVPLWQSANSTTCNPQSELRSTKAPFMQVIDEMRCENMADDELIIAECYPKLMRRYDEEMLSVYRAAEEACTRIIANTHLPDMRKTTPRIRVNEAFFESIHKLQTEGVPSSAIPLCAPKEAIVKFKDWIGNNHIGHDEDDLEDKIALSTELGVPLSQVSC